MTSAFPTPTVRPDPRPGERPPSPQPSDHAPVSVVMATYNGLRFLDAQLGSLLRDLRPADEVVVVDDASTDGTADRIESLGDPRVRLIRHAVNQGVRRSFEEGLRAARHPVVFLCDQDDVWLSGKRDRMAGAFARDERVTVVVCDARVIDGEGRTIAPSFMASRGGFHGGVLATVVSNRFLGCAMAVRRDVLDAALPIPARAPMHDMWIGAVAALRGRVVFVDDALIEYRRHGGNVSPSRRQSVGRMLRWRFDLVAALVARRLHGGWSGPSGDGRPAVR